MKSTASTTALSGRRLSEVLNRQAIVPLKRKVSAIFFDRIGDSVALIVCDVPSGRTCCQWQAGRETEEGKTCETEKEVMPEVETLLHND